MDKAHAQIDLVHAEHPAGVGHGVKTQQPETDGKAHPETASGKDRGNPANCLVGFTQQRLRQTRQREQQFVSIRPVAQYHVGQKVKRTIESEHKDQPVAQRRCPAGPRNLLVDLHVIVQPLVPAFGVQGRLAGYAITEDGDHVLAGITFL